MFDSSRESLNALQSQIRPHGLAKDREAFAKQKQDDLERQVIDLRSKIEANAPMLELEELSQRVDAALQQSKTANSAVSYVLNAEPGRLFITGGDAQIDRG